MPDGPKDENAGALPEAPRLPERSAIYIAPDGTVRFGALFEGLVPVAEAISGRSDIPGERIDTGGVPDPTVAGGRP